MRKTLFLDIDGTLVFHKNNMITQSDPDDFEVLPGVYEKIKEWERNEYLIILTTGRKESERKNTEKQLNNAGIMYDQLIMGLSRGPRVIINDFKPSSDEPTAFAVCVIRNQGLEGVDV